MGKTDSKFGQELDGILRDLSLSQTGLADQIGTSTAYVSAIRLGKKSVSPGRIDSISESLSLDAATSTRLHRAAAIDAGFKLDLPDDF